MGSGLVPGDDSGTDIHLHQGMVVCDLADPTRSGSNVIGTAVTHIGNERFAVVIHHTAHQGGSHTVILVRKLRIMKDYTVGLFAGRLHHVPDVRVAVHAGGQLRQGILREGTLRQLTGDTAGVLAADTVTHAADQKLFGEHRLEGEGVLILRSYFSLVS